MSKARKTRNSNTWTEAKYWGNLRSALRKTFQFWKPIQDAKQASKRVLSESDKEKRKWKGYRFGYECSFCGQLFKGKQVAVDHATPVGSLKQLSDLAGFVERLTSENVADYQVLCHDCHQTKTNIEAKERKLKRSGQTDLFS